MLRPYPTRAFAVSVHSSRSVCSCSDDGMIPSVALRWHRPRSTDLISKHAPRLQRERHKLRRMQMRLVHSSNSATGLIHIQLTGRCVPNWL